MKWHVDPDPQAMLFPGAVGPLSSEGGRYRFWSWLVSGDFSPEVVQYWNEGIPEMAVQAAIEAREAGYPGHVIEMTP